MALSVYKDVVHTVAAVDLHYIHESSQESRALNAASTQSSMNERSYDGFSQE